MMCKDGKIESDEQTCSGSSDNLVSISFGAEGRGYQGGNFLNAVDEVASYFVGARHMETEDAANLLRVYADSLVRS